MTGLLGWADFAQVRAAGAVECIDPFAAPERLDRGVWFLVADFDGRARAWRFAQVQRRDGATRPERPADHPGAAWRGPEPTAWTSATTRTDYEAGVRAVRARIREGDVYQVNLCRMLSAPLPSAGGAEPDAYGLAGVLAQGNPAPYAGLVHVPAGCGVEPVWVVTASPELYLAREGATISSGPIKGTAATAESLLAKDRAENVMITDLVRNDLQRVCAPGSVTVERLLAVEQHPGLTHLVSTVSGRLTPGAGWAEILGATFPPASVSGAPKLAALDVIRALEPAARGAYCGAVGWIDGDRERARLAVGIRTFTWSDGTLGFGTGAGITWGSDPHGEWEETQLKARRLVGLTSQQWEER
ncbi:MAG: chorismate-binding protein [Cellulomonadaceae bacterium]